MESFKRITQKLFLSLLLLGLSFSCSMGSDDSEKETHEAQNLIVSSLSSSSPQEVFQNADSVTRPTHKSYLITACFKDSAYLDDIRNHQFSINTEPSTQTRTDSQGCLRWREVLEVNSSFSARYYIINRQISSLERFEGSIDIEFAINVVTNRFVDLRYEDLPDDEVTVANKDDMEVDFDLTNLTMFYGGYDTQHDDSRALKRVITMFIGCFSIKVDMSPMANQLLEIKVLDLYGEVVQKIHQETDLNGCARTNLYTEYDQFDQVQWFDRRLEIKALEGPLRDQVLTRDIFINPWVTGRNHGWDSRSGEPPQNPTQETAKLHIDSLRYSFLGNTSDGYRVNEHLDLELTKKYLLELRPKIDRGHSFSSNQLIDPIYTGTFKLSMAILSPQNGELELTNENIKDFKTLSGAEREVEVRDGKIITPVELPFRFNDLPAAATRTIAILKLAPLDPEAHNLEPIIVSGSFLASSHQLSIGMRPNNRDLDIKSELNLTPESIKEKLTEASQRTLSTKPVSKWKGSSLEIFHALHKDSVSEQEDIQTLNLSRANTSLELKMNETQFYRMVKNPENKEQLKKFCRAFFPQRLVQGFFRDTYQDTLEYKECLRNPNKYLKPTTNRFVESIESNPRRLYTSTDRISVGTGFFVYRGERRSTTNSRRVSAGVGLNAKIEIPFLSFLSLGGGVNADVARTWSTSQDQGSSTRSSFSRSRNLYVDELVLGFDAKVRDCVLVEGAVYTKRQRVPYGRSTRYEDVEVREDKRVQVCANQAQKDWIEESWYYIGESEPANTILRDRWSVEENYLAKIIRGRDNYDQFYNFMSNDTRVVFLEKIDTMRSVDDYLQQYYRVDGQRPVLEDGAIPGVIQGY